MLTNNYNLLQIESHLNNLIVGDLNIFHNYGITKDPEENNFMIVMHMRNSLCEGCKQFNLNHIWCQSCTTRHFQQNFNNWTSGDHNIDEFIQNAQLKAES